MKKITLLLVLSLTAVVLAFYAVRNYVNNRFEVKLVSDTPLQDMKLTKESEKVDIKAAFLIFTSGTKRDFSALMYHNLSPNAYLSGENPNVVTVTKKGVTWKEFFETLPMELKKDCLITGTKQTFCSGNAGVLKFYLNGARDDDLLVREINDGDKALITFGPEAEPNLEYQLSQIPTP